MTTKHYRLVPNPATLPELGEQLRDWGYNPREVLIEGITARGYQRIDLDENGEKHIDPRTGTLARTFTAWADPDHGEFVLDHLIEVCYED